MDIEVSEIMWLIGQFGILIEIVGAIWIVRAAYLGVKNQEDSYVNHVATPLSEIRNMETPGPATYDALIAIIDEFKQISKTAYRNELIGFGLLAFGLLLQLLGNF